jgi:hypothetical protein
MASHTISPAITLIVKGVKKLGTKKLPDDTICLKTVKLSGKHKLPEGTVAVRAVKLRGAKSKVFGEFAVESLPIDRTGRLPAECVFVESVFAPNLKQRFKGGLAVEVVGVLDDSEIRELGIRVPIIPPKIKPK